MKRIVETISLPKKRLGWWCVLMLVLVGVTLTSIYSPKTKIANQPATRTDYTDSKIKGVWINYLEFSSIINGHDERSYQKEADIMLDKIADLGLNTVFLHVRSHSDSFYPSAIFPWSSYINKGAGVSYDPLAYFVEQAHKRQIAVHAWVNPYRISTGTLDELNANNPAYNMRKDSNRVVAIDSGVYYNPASSEVRSLVLSGVREIIENYKVDGIQYDDYFYPTDDKSFDSIAYHQYCDATATPMTLADWRRCQVNLLISGTYQLTRQFPGVAFGVSPAADSKRNYESLYADAAAWVDGGYVDYLCPQLYFGFEYPLEAFQFDHLIDSWQKLAGSVPLYIGLASYKVGEMDADSTEWVTSTDLLARETDYAAAASGVTGICFYHYTSLFKEDSISIAQRENVKKALTRLQ